MQMQISVNIMLCNLYDDFFSSSSSSFYSLVTVAAESVIVAVQFENRDLGSSTRIVAVVAGLYDGYAIAGGWDRVR